ncbi:MAG: septum formation initiator family protein [Bacteroidales bacterium]
MKVFQNILKKILPALRNKYILAILIFLLWIIFFDQNNLVDRVRQMQRNTKLEDEKAYYLDKIEEDSAKLHQLKTDAENLEEFAREQYYMKKDDEDIYIVVEEE